MAEIEQTLNVIAEGLQPLANGPYANSIFY